MKVALVHDWLTGFRGGEKCLEVLCRLFPKADLYTLLRRPGSTSPTIERMNLATSFLQHLPGISRFYRYYLPLMPLAVERLRIPSNVDLVISLSHAVAKNIKPPAGVPHVCYCFTPMRYAWHMRQQYFGEAVARLKSPAMRAFDRILAIPRNEILNRLQEWDQNASARVSHFIAISETVRKRIADCYNREATVICPPVDVDFYTPTFHKREDFVLCVSALVPYKRIDLAIEACNLSQRRLVVIGSGPLESRLRKLAGPTVRFLGWQPNEVIRDHLRRCKALVFPGFEDFGIVPLEAQACGTPVVAFGRGGAAETVLPADDRQRGTGVLFDQQCPAAINEALDWFDENRDQVSATLAHRHAGSFKTEHFERKIVDYLRSVVRGIDYTAVGVSNFAISAARAA
jgi:glycosyltransferase involved in cell wall biosynthesis